MKQSNILTHSNCLDVLSTSNLNTPEKADEAHKSGSKSTLFSQFFHDWGELMLAGFVLCAVLCEIIWFIVFSIHIYPDSTADIIAKTTRDEYWEDHTDDVYIPYDFFLSMIKKVSRL